MLVLTTMDLPSYSITSGIQVVLTIVISIIRTIKIHILINLVIKMTNLIDSITFMTVKTDILALDNRQCYWNSTGN